MLKCSSHFTPESLEYEKLSRYSVVVVYRCLIRVALSVPMSSYNPRNPIYTHASFPTQPLAMADNQQFIDKLPVDTLFLAFYYQQGSYQQFLAAEKLKQASWRFHKKYLTWFQRHEEPKRSTDLFEEGNAVHLPFEMLSCNVMCILTGTYVYFDYESGKY